MGVDLADAYTVLLSNEIEVHHWDGEWTVLRRPGSRALRYKIVPLRRIDSIDVVLRTLAEIPTRLLVVTEQETPALIRMAASRDIAVVSTKTRSCRIDGRAWPVASNRATKPNYKLWALARLMLATTKPLRQASASMRSTSSRRTSLEGILKVSQPRVSTLMHELPAGSVIRTRTGWVVSNVNQLWEWHAAEYPGPGGIRTSWHSEREPEQQAKDLQKAIGRAVAADDRQRHRTRSLKSGSLALPAGISCSPQTPVVRISTCHTSLMPRAHYTRCAARDATVQLVLPADSTLFITASPWGDQSRTDPLITAWEVLHDQQNLDAGMRLRSWAEDYARNH